MADLCMPLDKGDKRVGVTSLKFL